MGLHQALAVEQVGQPEAQIGKQDADDGDDEKSDAVGDGCLHKLAYLHIRIYTRRNEQIDALVQAMLHLNTEEEAYSFFEDIFTIKELQAVAQRLAVAGLLKKRVTYQDIAEQTGASTATISRVNRSLTYGAGGYQLVLSRMGSNAQSDTDNEE